MAKKVTTKTEVVKTSRKAGPKKKDNKLKIMTELEKIISEGAILGVTNEQLAAKFNVRRQTIAEYLKQIYAKIPPEDIKETEVKLKVMFDKIFRYAQRIMNNAQTSLEQERALRLLMSCMKEYTDFLERFGWKPTAIQNVNVQGEIDNHITIEVVKTDRIVEAK